MVALINCLSYTTNVLNKLLGSVCCSFFSADKKRKKNYLQKDLVQKGTYRQTSEVDSDIEPSSFRIESQILKLFCQSVKNAKQIS